LVGQYNNSEHATKEVIMNRYRILMKANHPDMGGSPFLSTKVNEAKVNLIIVMPPDVYQLTIEYMYMCVLYDDRIY
jgi:hypothetical protein